MIPAETLVGNPEARHADFGNEWGTLGFLFPELVAWPLWWIIGFVHEFTNANRSDQSAALLGLSNQHAWIIRPTCMNSHAGAA
jgi:hypothetical protein